MKISPAVAMLVKRFAACGTPSTGGQVTLVSAGALASKKVRQSTADLKITQQDKPDSASEASSMRRRESRGPPVVIRAEIVARLVPAGRLPRYRALYCSVNGSEEACSVLSPGLAVLFAPVEADLEGRSARDGTALVESRCPEKAEDGAVVLLTRLEGARFATFAQEDAVGIWGR